MTRVSLIARVAFVCLLAVAPALAENVGCMVYNNGLNFTEEELQRLETAPEVQYVGVQMGGGSSEPHYREVASRLARSGKKLILQIWWGPDPPRHAWSRFSIANIAMDAKIREEFFREVIDPLIDSVGPENIHAAHMLEETAGCFATDMREPGDPEDLMDGTGGVYASPYYSGFSGRDMYGGPWMLTLRRHNQDFRRYSNGYDLFKAAIWRGPPRNLFRRWVGQRVQALGNNHFADHLHKKYPGILATTWDSPNYGGNAWADTPAMMNNLDGFTSNCYSSPLHNYIFARSMKVLDYDKEMEFIAATRPWLDPDANKRQTTLTPIYAVGSNVIGLWHEPNRIYQNDDDAWKVTRRIFGALSRLPVFRHTPDVFYTGGWSPPTPFLKNFDACHAYDSQGVGLGRYRLVLGADHPGLKDYVADGGLAVAFGNCPRFLRDEGILVPGDKPVERSGPHEPDDWWRRELSLAARYELGVKPAPEYAAEASVRSAAGIVYHVPYGEGEILVLPVTPTNEGRDPDWQRFVYDLIRGLLHANGMDDVFENHFAPWESGGNYFEITSDDGAVTCYFYYEINQEGPPVQVKGVDVFTGDRDPVLGPGRSSAIVAHSPTRPWEPPPAPDRTKLVKAAEKGARRGLPKLPELPPGHSLGGANVALEPAPPARWVGRGRFRDWAVDECRYRLVIRCHPAPAAMDQLLVLSGREFYDLTGLDDLSWKSIRAFTGGRERPIQVDERDGTGQYVPAGNGRLDVDDELVFAVGLQSDAPVTVELYYDNKPGMQPEFPDAGVTFEKIDTITADAVLGNGRLTARLKGPARNPDKDGGLENAGAGSITGCSLDGKGFTRIRSHHANLLFGQPFTNGDWTKPELVISGPLRTIVRMRLPETVSRDNAGRKTFEGTVTSTIAMYGTMPVMDIEQQITYRWSDRKWSATYSFYATVGQALDSQDMLFVPLGGQPHRFSMRDIVRYDRAYLEHRPEAGWMALLDPEEKHGYALFYAKMPEIRENLAWVDYSPRRELTPSVFRWAYGYRMQLRYVNRVMQLDDRITRRFRFVGLTEEDEHAVAAQYSHWGEELTRLARVEVQSRKQ